MSTITESVTLGNSTVHRQSGGWAVRGTEIEQGLTYGTRIQGGSMSIAGMPTVIREPSKHSGKRPGIDLAQPKVKRRLQGFFIQAEGTEARVALVDKGTLVHYYLPLALLHEGGVRTENQPFELDELEAKIGGVVMTGTKIRASAPAEASEVRPLPLDEAYQRKLERILRR